MLQAFKQEGIRHHSLGSWDRSPDMTSYNESFGDCIMFFFPDESSVECLLSLTCFKITPLVHTFIHTMMEACMLCRHPLFEDLFSACGNGVGGDGIFCILHGYCNLQPNTFSCNFWCKMTMPCHLRKSKLIWVYR